MSKWIKIGKFEKKEKPEKCCNVGTYKCNVMIPDLKDKKNRPVYVDRCILKAVVLLNKNGFRTMASCCGHGQIPPTILLDINDIVLKGLNNDT